MRTKYKIKFDRITFVNRWIKDRVLGWSDYTLIGIRKFWFSPTQFEWQVCFFGLEMRIWLIREYVK